MQNDDLSFGREFTVEIADPADMADAASKQIFAVCVRSDDESLLVPMKIYRIKPREENVLVIDEKGEAAVYPNSFFTPLKLAPALEKVLSKTAL